MHVTETTYMHSVCNILWGILKPEVRVTFPWFLMGDQGGSIHSCLLIIRTSSNRKIGPNCWAVRITGHGCKFASKETVIGSTEGKQQKHNSLEKQQSHVSLRVREQGRVLGRTSAGAAPSVYRLWSTLMALQISPVVAQCQMLMMSSRFSYHAGESRTCVSIMPSVFRPVNIEINVNCYTR